jgi:hypothetical protein
VFIQTSLDTFNSFIYRRNSKLKYSVELLADVKVKCGESRSGSPGLGRRHPRFYYSAAFHYSARRHLIALKIPSDSQEPTKSS